MPTGSCLCGNIAIEFTGQPTIGLCHCLDCRKITSSLWAYNIIVSNEQLKVLRGTPKEYTKTADSGKSITTCFCPNCGTTLFRYGESFGGKTGTKIIKAGILDDLNVINNGQPTKEVYTARRVTWLMPQEGAAQYKGEH
ncbi:Mss4-like protein [Leptodontidium sp. 2 PMI_412]|nr:Mss4-like protein [Leptodontidium sp. 2 PMI_412]